MPPNHPPPPTHNKKKKFYDFGKFESLYHRWLAVAAGVTEIATNRSDDLIMGDGGKRWAMVVRDERLWVMVI